MAKDVLARGGRKAQFGGPSGITQKQWDAIWEEEKPKEEKKVNGEQSSK